MRNNMNTQILNNENNLSPKRVRWWLRVALGVAGVVVLITIISPALRNFSPVFRRFGPATNPVKDFLEEIILEELIGVSDFFYFTYPYSVGLIIIISALFYAFIAGVIVWGFERRKVVKPILILSLTVFMLVFLWVQGFQIAFFNFQCVATPTADDRSKIFSLVRTCPIASSPYFSIPSYLYDSTKPETMRLFEGMVISEEEFERIKEHNGNVRYFCGTGCERNHLQCRLVVDNTCRKCTDDCYQDYRETREGAGHIVDLLKSETFQQCINRCRP